MSQHCYCIWLFSFLAFVRTRSLDFFGEERLATLIIGRPGARTAYLCRVCQVGVSRPNSRDLAILKWFCMIKILVSF